MKMIWMRYLKLIFAFAEDEAGIKSFKSSRRSLEIFMDDYKQEKMKKHTRISLVKWQVQLMKRVFQNQMNKKDLAQKASESFIRSRQYGRDYIKTASRESAPTAKAAEPKEIPKGYKA